MLGVQAKIDGACQRKRALGGGGREGGPLKDEAPASPGFRRTFSASRVGSAFSAVALDMQELAVVPESRSRRTGGRTVIGRCLFNIFSAAQRQKRQSSVWSLKPRPVTLATCIFLLRVPLLGRH